LTGSGGAGQSRRQRPPVGQSRRPRDVRRLRPNILIGGVHDLGEVAWPGAELHIGEAIVRLESLRGRCAVTTVDPDTLDRDPEVLRDIVRRSGGRLALNADVARGGTITVGDAVTLVRARSW
jgi:uncharacterized protein YcbX